MDLTQLFSRGMPGLAGLFIEVAKPTDVSTSALTPAYLRYEREFAKVRSAVAEREAVIEMARAEECDAVLALREKQEIWNSENPDIEGSEENAEYMAFIEPEFSAAEAAIRHSYELKAESNAFLQTEYPRLRDLAAATADETAKDLMGEAEAAPATEETAEASSPS